MNMNYISPSTMYESIFAHMYVYLVLFTILLFAMKKSFKEKLQKQTNIFLLVYVHVNVFL